MRRLGLSGRSGAGVVAFAGIDAEFAAGFVGGDIDGAIAAIALEQSRLVGDQIAAADDLLKVVEAAIEPADGAGDEGGAAGVFSQHFQGAVADGFMAAGLEIVTDVVNFAGADGIDKDLTVFGGGDGFFQRIETGVVFAVADDDEDAGDGMIFGAGGEFVGGEGDGVPERGAAGGSELIDGVDHFGPGRW